MSWVSYWYIGVKKKFDYIYGMHQTNMVCIRVDILMRKLCLELMMHNKQWQTSTEKSVPSFIFGIDIIPFYLIY